MLLQQQEQSLRASQQSLCSPMASPSTPKSAYNTCSAPNAAPSSRESSRERPRLALARVSETSEHFERSTAALSTRTISSRVVRHGARRSTATADAAGANDDVASRLGTALRAAVARLSGSDGGSAHGGGSGGYVPLHEVSVDDGNTSAAGFFSAADLFGILSFDVTQPDGTRINIVRAPPEIAVEILQSLFSRIAISVGNQHASRDCSLPAIESVC